MKLKRKRTEKYQIDFLNQFSKSNLENSSILNGFFFLYRTLYDCPYIPYLPPTPHILINIWSIIANVNNEDETKQQCYLFNFIKIRYPRDDGIRTSFRHRLCHSSELTDKKNPCTRFHEEINTTWQRDKPSTTDGPSLDGQRSSCSISAARRRAGSLRIALPPHNQRIQKQNSIEIINGEIFFSLLFNWRNPKCHSNF